MNNTKKTLLDIIKVSNREVEFAMSLYKLDISEDDIVINKFHIETSTGGFYAFNSINEMYEMARDLQSYIIEECIFESLKNQVVL